MSSRVSSLFRRTFTLRLGAWYLALFAVSAVTLLAVTYFLLAQAMASQDRTLLESMLSRYGAEYQRDGLLGLQALLVSDAQEGRHERLLVRVTNGRTEAIYFAEPLGWNDFDLSTVDQLSTPGSQWTRLGHAQDDSVLDVGTLTLPDGITIQVGRTSRVRDEILGHFRARALALLLLVGVIALIGGAFVTHIGLAPVRAMETAVRSILTTGRFDARVAAGDSRDPLDELGHLINDMLGRIQSLVTSMRGALDNVAHDLRTPMTRFRNVAESALVADDPEAARDALVKAVEEAQRLTASLTMLMDISEAETGTMALTQSRVRVADVVNDAVDLYADEAEDRGVTLESKVDPALELHADPVRLRQVMANLIENAVKYTAPGGRVDVETRAESTAGAALVTIAVKDTGKGIAPEDIAHVWDRLYRGADAQSERGLGLGLSLVKAVVEAHGGHVSATSVPGQGSEFSVSFPQNP